MCVFFFQVNLSWFFSHLGWKSLWEIEGPFSLATLSPFIQQWAWRQGKGVGDGTGCPRLSSKEGGPEIFQLWLCGDKRNSCIPGQLLHLAWATFWVRPFIHMSEYTHKSYAFLLLLQISQTPKAVFKWVSFRPNCIFYIWIPWNSISSQ